MLSFSFISTIRRTEWHFPQKRNVDVVLTYYHFHNGMRMRRCAAKTNTNYVCAWHEWTSSSSTPRTTRCVGNMRNVNICGTQKRRSVLRKVAPNCLPALRKQNASLGTCETNTNTTSSDDFPLDRRPPPRVIFSEFQGSHVNSESCCESDVCSKNFTKYLQFRGSIYFSLYLSKF